MRLTSLSIALSLSACPLVCAAQEDEAVVVEIDDAVADDAEDAAEEAPDADDALEQRRQQRIEEMRKLLVELHEQRDKQGDDRDAVEARLRELLLERGLEEAPQRNRFNLGQPGGPIVLGGKLLEAQKYETPYAELPRDEVVARLNDPSFTVRQYAETHLLADNTLDRAALAELLKQATTAEQRNRLIRVAEHHVMREVREQTFGKDAVAQDEQGPEQFRRFHILRESASVGFSYQPVISEDHANGDTPAVRVTATMPGFPGHACLRPGDLVVGVGGQTANGIRHNDLMINWVSNRIANHQPGETIRFTIVREGKALEIELICAEGAALRAMYLANERDAPFRASAYTQMWQDAYAQLTADLPGPKALTPAP